MAPQEIDQGLFSRDVGEFISLLHKHAVRYMLVGGHAAIVYGHARVTGDADIFYARDAANCDRLFDALLEFWQGQVPGVERSGELAVSGLITQFGRPPNRLDLINQIDGVQFDAAWPRRAVFHLAAAQGPVPVNVLSREDFIQNKRASGRPKDLDDLQALGE